MYTETTLVLSMILFLTIGIMIGVFIKSITKTYGRWQYGPLWYVTNERGDLIRSQFEHPSQGVKDAERTLKVSRGE